MHLLTVMVEVVWEGGGSWEDRSHVCFTSCSVKDSTDFFPGAQRGRSAVLWFWGQGATQTDGCSKGKRLNASSLSEA